MSGEVGRVGRVSKLEATLISAHDRMFNLMPDGNRFWALLFRKHDSAQLRAYLYTQEALDEGPEFKRIIPPMLHDQWDFIAVIEAISPRSDGTFAPLQVPPPDERQLLTEWQNYFSLKEIWVTNSLHSFRLSGF